MLARRVWPDGRTRAYVCGRSATVADLRDLGGRLRRLLRPARAPQADALGRAARHPRRSLRPSPAGAPGAGGRDLRARPRAPSSGSRELREMAGARERELDLLAFELDEIEAVAPSEEEEDELVAERDRLRHLDDAAARRGGRSRGDLARRRAAGSSELLAAGRAPARGARPGSTHALQALSERLQALRYEAEDLGRRAARLPARARVDGGEGAAGALEEVEERLALFARLQRKHGGTIADVLAHAERCRARRERARARRRRARVRRGRAGRGPRASSTRWRPSSPSAAAQAAPGARRGGAGAAGRARDARRGVRGDAAPAARRLRAARSRRRSS